MGLQLKEILTRSISDLSLARQLTHCTAQATAEEVTRLLQASSGGSIVVLEGKKLLGIFTERDVLKKVTLNPKDPKTVRITEIMTPNPVTVKRSSNLEEVLKKMRDGKFRHLVMVDAYGNAEGVVSMRDIMDYLAGLLIADGKN
jgi:CBS domain-containing protein